jgi:hypothetical protein
MRRGSFTRHGNGRNSAELAEIAPIRSEHGDSQTPGAHSDQRIVCQSSSTNFLVIILGQRAERGLCQFESTEIRLEDAFGAVKITLQTFHLVDIVHAHSCVQFFQTTELSHTGESAASLLSASAAPSPIRITVM